MTDDHGFPDREHAAERYVLGEMSDTDRDRYEEHFFACAECAEDVRTTAAFLHDVRRYTTAGMPGRPAAAAPMASRVSRPAWWYRSPVIPWAIAASLLVFIAYRSLVLVPGLPDKLSPRALYPVTLRPDSRGQEPVRLTGTSDAFALAIEINDVEEGTLMDYEIATADGRHRISGRAAAPRAGVPLILLVPSSALEESASYELSMHDAATGRLLGSYHFQRSH